MADTCIELMENDVNGNDIGIQTVDSGRVDQQGAVFKAL